LYKLEIDNYKTNNQSLMFSKSLASLKAFSQNMFFLTTLNKQ